MSAHDRVEALTALNAGETVETVCTLWGISSATLYGWKKNYAGLSIKMVEQVDQLGQLNAELYRRITTLELDITILQEALDMQALRSDEKRMLIYLLKEKFLVSLARMSRLLRMSRSFYEYEPMRERR